MVHEAVREMLDSYECVTAEDRINALRDVLQRLALLGLWRSRFYEHAAFYGGTALRLLYGLDRFSEDLDFSLLAYDADFSLDRYCGSLKREIESFGFSVDVQHAGSERVGTIDSAMMGANVLRQLILVDAGEEVSCGVHPGKLLKIKMEIDIDPPGNFGTETRYMLRPFPVPVRTYRMPDMFAGKLHAVLCRRWRNRVKGRDWYDLVWFSSRYPKLHLAHLEARMRKSGDYADHEDLTLQKLRTMLEQAVEKLDVDSAREEVSRFVRDPRTLETWSRELFLEAVMRITAFEG